MDADKFLSVLDCRWLVGFDEDGPGKPLAPVNLTWIRVVDLVPEVVKRICDRDPALGGTHAQVNHLVFRHNLVFLLSETG